jgi:hypothetical protein
MNQQTADKAFETALACGALSHDESSPLYVGAFMYMGDDAEGRHLFKHRNTRAYIAPVKAVRS